MLTREILKEIKKVEISTRKAVNNLMGGEYKSVFKGRGMEFDEVRPYSHGDQVSSIDWKVTARTGAPFIKKFVEERELTVHIVVDASASQSFGSVTKSKRELVTEVAALLAFSAIKNNDRVGLLLFSDDVELFLPPRKGRTHVMRVIRELVTASPSGKGTSIGNAMEYIGRVAKTKSIVFLISDFLDEGYEKQLKIISRKHDLILIRVKDPMEAILPDDGLIELKDSETGQRFTIDAADSRWKASFMKEVETKDKKWESFIRSQKIDSIDLLTSTPYVVPLRNFFKRRSQRY